MARRKQQETTGYIIIAIFAGILFWLLSKGKNFLHESVTTEFLPPDPVTGAPMFNPAVDVPPGEEFAIPPICGPGAASFTPANPKACTCPSGYTLWKNAGNGNYECIPVN
jgi:hypothetical protein